MWDLFSRSSALHHLLMVLLETQYYRILLYNLFFFQLWHPKNKKTLQDALKYVKPNACEEDLIQVTILYLR